VTIIAEVQAALEAGAVVAVVPPGVGPRIVVLLFPLADGQGFVFIEDGFFTPGYTGHAYHLVKGAGEAVAPGRWRFGRIEVVLLGEADPHYQPALEARTWLEANGAFTTAKRARARESARYLAPLADEAPRP
jgi:hypothetical protein